MSRKGKFIKTESGTVIAWGRGGVATGKRLRTDTRASFGMMEIFEHTIVMMVVLLYEVAKVTESYTCNWWILRYVNYTSIKMFKKKIPT